jgi:uncharacterized damage-inducible protein DinB
VSAEQPVLQAALREARRHVVGILDGLSDAQMHQPVSPSGWTCVGMVNHLALDVEQFWFRAVMAGDDDVWASLRAEDRSAWDVGVDVSPTTVMARYAEAARQADEVLAGTPLTAPPARWPEEIFGSWRLDDLREITMHVIRETSCHAGHLDAAREVLDGRQWMVLDTGRMVSDREGG